MTHVCRYTCRSALGDEDSSLVNGDPVYGGATACPDGAEGCQIKCEVPPTLPLGENFVQVS